MKQQITVEQLKELPPRKMIELAMWQHEHDYDNGLPTIGQMIEYLDECRKIIRSEDTQRNQYKLLEWPYDKELCDDLWEAVKKYLTHS